MHVIADSLSCIPMHEEDDSEFITGFAVYIGRMATGGCQ